MTATRVFLLFLKEKCTSQEYFFFKNTILYDNGNKFFRKRALYKDTFVEDYLSRNNRALNNFMIRLFILAPNLVKNKLCNPRYSMLKDEWNNTHKQCWYFHKSNGAYVEYYRRLWNNFLKEYIDDSNKKFNSPFKKKEVYDFILKK